MNASNAMREQQRHIDALCGRTLAHVLLDIAEARSREKASWDAYKLDPDSDLECAALDRLDALTDEARAMIEAATGITWDQISSACL